jgi:hypothetical protein
MCPEDQQPGEFMRCSAVLWVEVNIKFQKEVEVPSVVIDPIHMIPDFSIVIFFFFIFFFLCNFAVCTLHSDRCINRCDRHPAMHRTPRQHCWTKRPSRRHILPDGVRAEEKYVWH